MLAKIFSAATIGIEAKLIEIEVDITIEESLETTKIHSVCGLIPLKSSIIRTRPFRTPHHTASDISLVGGGSVPKPGEVSLAHNGVLFMDELPEFHRNVLEGLRQPLEDGHVTISRINSVVRFPSKFMLVCAMNPCACETLYKQNSSYLWKQRILQPQ